MTSLFISTLSLSVFFFFLWKGRGVDLNSTTNLSLGAHATALIGTVSALKRSKGLVSEENKKKMRAISLVIAQAKF